jgi:phage gp46-like protein
MADIATILDSTGAAGDWRVTGGDLAGDATMATAVLLSLLTDRRAGADDVLPDPRDKDRRGWWGDLALEGEAAESLGSRLWLLSRAPANDDTRRRAELYIRESLGWMVRDRVATGLAIATEWQGSPATRLAVRLLIQGPAGDRRFDLLWLRTEAA